MSISFINSSRVHRRQPRSKLSEPKTWFSSHLSIHNLTTAPYLDVHTSDSVNWRFPLVRTWACSYLLLEILHARNENFNDLYAEWCTEVLTELSVTIYSTI